MFHSLHMQHEESAAEYHKGSWKPKNQFICKILSGCVEQCTPYCTLQPHKYQIMRIYLKPPTILAIWFRQNVVCSMKDKRKIFIMPNMSGWHVDSCWNSQQPLTPKTKLFFFFVSWLNSLLIIYEVKNQLCRCFYYWKFSKRWRIWYQSWEDLSILLVATWTVSQSCAQNLSVQ